jgi:NADPH:quinone reductase-like Zn-dependent oxidoreductase
MKQVVIHRFGSASELSLAEAGSPSIGPGQIRVQNVAASVNPYDWMVRRGDMKFLSGTRFPMVLGSESAGVVTHVGSAVKSIQLGARVIALCGRAGGYAQEIAIAADRVVPLPEGVTFEAGAALPVAGSTAWDALYHIAKITRHQRILIYGAAGGVGTFAVQLAKLAGCHVTAMARSEKHALLGNLGADQIYDYTQPPLAQLAATFDVIFDTPSVLSYPKVKNLLSDRGVYIATLPSSGTFFWWGLTALTAKKCRVVFAKPSTEKVAALAKLVNNGLLRVVIDRTYPIALAADAHRYSETKRATGKIVLKC